jgi:hypothetical protein
MCVRWEPGVRVEAAQPVGRARELSGLSQSQLGRGPVDHWVRRPTGPRRIPKVQRSVVAEFDTGAVQDRSDSPGVELGDRSIDHKLGKIYRTRLAHRAGVPQSVISVYELKIVNSEW